MSKVVVIGAGAAGAAAAIAAARNHHEVILLEKNDKIGKKLFITGKGRCNVTNASDIETIMSQVVTNKKFMYSAFYTFDNQGIMQLIEDAGCKLKVERGNRVFPVSDHSSDVIKALLYALKEAGVTLEFQANVESIVVEHDRVMAVEGTCHNKKKLWEADAVILATGGLSYPLTGSTGDGYRMARNLGHKVTRLTPSLVPFTIQEEWCKSLQGLALKNVSAQVYVNQKQVYTGFGEMLFTHFGVSGPLMLSASSYYVGHSDVQEAKVVLDLKPALSHEQLDSRILREFEVNNKKHFKNVIGTLYPAKLTPIMIAQSGIDPDKGVYEITKEERGRIVTLTKALTLTITGTRGYSEAIITKGGIAVQEVNPSTMESKLVKGLHFAGEVLDVDALTGGYNLQVAWSTGYLAGLSIDHKDHL